MELATIRHLVEADLNAADTLISRCLHSEINLIQQLSEYLIQSGGKRLRPLIVLLAARAFSYEGEGHIKLAAVIELIHTATLLHDDVVDTSELRRGKKTANAVWGNAASVLVGDFLYSRGFQLMEEYDILPIMAALAKATNSIAEGEILQLLNCKNPETSEENYLRVIRCKTGMLFATAAQLGPILCHRSPETIQHLFEYGMHLGTAFQLVDDALDYASTAETIGKNRGDDLAEGKPTLPLLYALKNAQTHEQALIREAIIQADVSQFEKVLSAIESTQAIPYTYRLAQQHAEQAIAHLSDIPDSSYRTALIALAQFSVARQF